MQYGPNLPERHVPNGQVPNYLPIPYAPTYLPTTQRSDMVPPLTMQYGPNLPEHHVPNGQVPNYLPIPVPNYLPIPCPPTYHPTTQHGDMVPPLTMQYGPTLPEHYVPNGQVPNYLPIPVPNYLPIPYPPTYLPTTQHSDVVPPLTMQYGPYFPEHYATNGQVPNHPPESYPTTYNPNIQHGGKQFIPGITVFSTPQQAAHSIRTLVRLSLAFRRHYT